MHQINLLPWPAAPLFLMALFRRSIIVILNGSQLDGRTDADVMQDALLEITGGRSVPRVFINGRFLGGGDDTAAAAANGTLQQLLTQAEVL